MDFSSVVANHHFGFVVPLLFYCQLDFVVRRFVQWGVKDSNLRRHCHQIYSLTPLTTRETPLAQPLSELGLLMHRPRCNETRFEQYSAKKQGGVFVQASGGT
jgi:hypothetical protein